MVVGKPVPRHLAGIHDGRQAGKHRVGQPMAAQIVPNALDRIELRALRRQLQQGDIARHHESLAPMPTGTIEDQHGMGILGNLATDLAEMMVHGQGIADRHDQPRRFALRWADRPKQIGRGKAEVLGCRRPTPAIEGCSVAHYARADHDLGDVGLRQRRDRAAVNDPADAGPNDRAHAYRARLAGWCIECRRPSLGCRGARHSR